MAALVLSVLLDNAAEWKRYQNEYRDLVLVGESNLTMRKIANEMELRIQQNFLPGLNRIDRCITCHAGIQNPNMKNEKMPFQTHPGNLLKDHSPERFGCTVCHGGQGRATAKKAAHGDISHWRLPLRTPEQIEAACGVCHREEKLSFAPRLAEGRRIFRTQGCIGCHRVGKRGRDECPELTRVALKDFTGDHRVDREDWNWHEEHLLDPPSKAESTIMPNFGLERAEATALTFFLNSLTGDSIDSRYIVPQVRDLQPKSREELGYLEVFQGYGCAACHGPEAGGGRLNPNSQSGGKVPSLVKVRQGYTKSELIQKIKKGVHSRKLDSAGPVPPLNMPSWNELISDEELDCLATYLFHLSPPEEDDDWDADDWEDELVEREEMNPQSLGIEGDPNEMQG